MNQPPITIRPARCEDAEIIAKAVAMAIGDASALRDYCGDDHLGVLTEIVCTAGTQYSWQRAIIAECEGCIAGAVVGYDGAHLQELRAGTLSVIRRLTGLSPTIADETEAGEYYLDSVAVMPSFRGVGVGRQLIEAFCERAFASGAERVGLIVDCANPSAERLYRSVGFECVGERTFFGHTMRHLQRSK